MVINIRYLETLINRSNISIFPEISKYMLRKEVNKDTIFCKFMQVTQIFMLTFIIMLIYSNKLPPIMASSWLDVRLFNSSTLLSSLCNLRDVRWNVFFFVVHEFLSCDVRLVSRLLSSSSFWDSSLSSLLGWTCEVYYRLKWSFPRI